MGAKGSVEAAKINAQNWSNFEHNHSKQFVGHHQRSQSLNRGVREQWSGRGADLGGSDMW
ncbi:uncharacterized protein LOC143193180 [Rhynchophorus ferrugineus]|uniref:uncharacterized protein LOC143193180 n=1 Tax=Rhynchophorus ferrugineus TaxID=354439 RepID=UPI003FCD9DB1